MLQKELQEEIRLLTQAFASDLPKRFERIERGINDIIAGRADVAGLHEVFREVHSLAGSASTFGQDRIGGLARQLETHLERLRAKGLPADAQMSGLLQASHRSLLDSVPVPAARGDTPAASAVSPPPPALEHRRKQLYLFGDDGTSSKEVSRQLAHFGFQVQCITAQAELVDRLQATPPDALIIDFDALDSPDELHGLQTSDIDSPRPTWPTLFVSSRGDWPSRLQAVRAGGSVFLPKPFDIPLLVNHLDRLLHQDRYEPYRVLIVDDDEILARHFALVLDQAGMQAKTLDNPERILREVVDFRPEIILMDVYMPEANGSEAAQVVRQHHEFFGLPIVFLSAEDNRDKQLEAMRQGDDFLQKPVRDDHLATAVRLRADRARALGRLMYHDGLTGLLNHISLKQRLETELGRCRRWNTPLSYVMLDIDHFKSVNDRYGHGAGDRVLRTLSRFLVDRLREVDQVGRYGGEEFGLILPETGADAAMPLLEGLREYFADIVHGWDGQEFQVSFSAGLVVADQSMNVDELFEAADAALYRAKESGRNRVILGK